MDSPPTSDIVVVTRGLTKTFGRSRVLHGVDFEMSRGSIVGFIGPNGAGKSTFLRALIGLVFRDGGTATVHGLDPATQALQVRRHTSYLPGETSIYSNMSGNRFLRFAWSFYPGARHDDLIKQAIGEFGLPLRQRVRQYSAGMKQKLALLATIGPKVPLYILDEPDRALDATTRFFLRDLLLELAKRGAAVLLSSHHLSEVEAVADRLDFLVDGKMVPAATIDAIRDTHRRRIRLQLTQPDAQLPPGHELVTVEPDGTRVLDVASDPVAYLSKLEPNQVRAAEIGLTRLEDVYRALTVNKGEPKDVRQVNELAGDRP